MTHFADSAGKQITVGNAVIFRGEVFTIKAFHPGQGRNEIARIEFNEPITHTKEMPDEWNVDLTEMKKA